MNRLKRLFISGDLWKYCAHKSVRPLFSSSDLGMDSFILKKKEYQKSVQNPELYKARLKETCELDNKTLVFTDDIFKIVYLADTDNDLDILHKLLHKICTQNKIKVEKYRFGAEVMRLYHLLNKPAEALALLNDEAIFSEIQSVNAFTIFLDLLFKNELYNEIIKMYDYRHRFIPETFSYRLTVVYFAACYKLNTQESFDRAFKMWQELVSANRYSKPGLKIRLFLAALALKQNHIDCAVELLYDKKFNSLTESIKSMAYAKSQRFNDAFERIKEILNSDLANNFFMPLEAVNYIEEEVFISGKEEDKEKFKQIKEELYSKNCIAFEIWRLIQIKTELGKQYEKIYGKLLEKNLIHMSNSNLQVI